jgi:hypothetical protein
MRHALWNVATTISLLICGAVAVCWVRSFWVRDAIEFSRDGERWEVASEFGRLRVGNAPQLRMDIAALANLNKQLGPDGRSDRPPDIRDYFPEQQRLMRKVKRAVPDARGMPQPRLQLRQYGLPHWGAMAAAALLPAAWWRARARRQRRIARGLCVTCGYDLRASPDRCPECGAVPARLPR